MFLTNSDNAWKVHSDNVWEIWNITSNQQTLENNYTLPPNTNWTLAGPYTIPANKTLEIPATSNLVIL